MLELLANEILERPPVSVPSLTDARRRIDVRLLRVSRCVFRGFMEAIVLLEHSSLYMNGQSGDLVELHLWGQVVWLEQQGLTNDCSPEAGGAIVTVIGKRPVYLHRDVTYEDLQNIYGF